MSDTDTDIAALEQRLDDIGSGASQHADFTPMERIAPTEPDADTFELNESGLRDAAAARAAEVELEERRATGHDTAAIERKYQYPDGSAVPANKTVSLKDAAVDLADTRSSEFAHQVASEAAGYAGEFDQAKDAIAQAQEYPQPDAQQQPPSGLDPEVEAALQRPAIRAAIAKEVEGVEAARQQYAMATRHASELAGAAMFSQFPELMGLNSAQIGGALQVIAANDPARHAAITAQLQQVEGLMKIRGQAEQQHAQVVQQQVEHWAKSQDALFEQKIAGDPVAQRLKQTAISDLQREYGIDPRELAQLWKNVPVMKSAIAQSILVDALKFRQAQRGVAHPSPRAVPPVIRPGTSRAVASHGDANIEALRRQFNSSPTPKNAALLLRAQRASR